MIPRIALTSGEPAGIGPELCLAMAGRSLPCELVCLGDRALLAGRAQALHLDVRLREPAPPGLRPAAPRPAGELTVEHLPLAVPSVAGRPDPGNARYVLALLDRAIEGVRAGEFDALVTAPVHKGVVNDAGIAFTGHTEYLQQRTGGRAVMMLVTGKLRVALATTHLPLRAVSAALSADLLYEVTAILARELSSRFRVSAPRIAVCGLNPHAGEGGHLGDEEQRIIAPALERLRASGIQVSGPLPADTVFVPRVLAGFDAVLAMYHDQGLPVIKHAGFEQAVNVTLGLPLIRTSPDHGTAFDLAGSGRADPSSLIAAVQLASTLAAQR
ncbi:MAG: 4-hydroxythreonine-4-phosphate dehydrogenase PdxA [Gammaproteobacteria bacterium]|nr:4-hydroxythreonine-4-phosphate dehydrogenase PdxA [Gammaproteobacteria bacterium]MBV8306237.1 4-hydroxythreonine-4-phosphate dehydrogenase PdxA [Gammaproteobacteria bacterium]MBV8402949.1 4-hydroxythreonine-4-phosphate dehydrogenase PdxA [Gammaproteobacteria bacterium]